MSDYIVSRGRLFVKTKDGKEYDLPGGQNPQVHAAIIRGSGFNHKGSDGRKNYGPDDILSVEVRK